MSKKFFSLIHGKKIHVAPKTKVIPASEFSAMVDAREVLCEVRADAEKYRIEVATECEKLKEQAQQEGFAQGYEDWVAKLAELEEEIRNVHIAMERVVVPIALKAAKKIVGRELETTETTILDIIRVSLKSVAQHKKIKIYVNKKDWAVVEAGRKRIKEVFENLEALSILPQDDIEPGGCIIETEGGIINAQLENQWMILEGAFQKLMHKPSVPKQETPPETAEEATAEDEGAHS